MILDVEEADSQAHSKYIKKDHELTPSLPEPEMELAAEDSDEENIGIKPFDIVQNEQDRSANTILATSEGDILGKHALPLPVKA